MTYVAHRVTDSDGRPNGGATDQVTDSNGRPDGRLIAWRANSWHDQRTMMSTAFNSPIE